MLLHVLLNGSTGGPGGTATENGQGGNGGTGQGARIIDTLIAGQVNIFNMPCCHHNILHEIVRSLTPSNGGGDHNGPHATPSRPSFFPIAALCFSLGFEVPRSLSSELLGLTILTLTVLSLRPWVPSRGRRRLFP